MKPLVAVPQIERATHAVALYLAGRSDLDVSQAEAHVLAYLHVHGEARINAIHAEFGHRRSTLTSVLDRLEARGAIERATDAGNRRSVVVSLTRAGQTLSARVYEALRSIEVTALRGCPAADIAAFTRVMERLLDAPRHVPAPVSALRKRV